jgi:hypothetical protein
MYVDDMDRVCFAIGDGRSDGGNAWLYRYDPATERIECILDMSLAAGPSRGPWGSGHGRIHAPLLADDEGRVYAASAPCAGDESPAGRPAGGVIVRIGAEKDAASQCYGELFPGEGIYGAVLIETKRAYAALTQPSGRCQIYDLGARKLIFRSAVAGGPEARMIAKDRRDRIYFCGPQGKVFRYDADLNTTEPVPMPLPSAGRLPTKDGNEFSLRDDLPRVMKLDGGNANLLIGITFYGLIFTYDVDGSATTLLGHALDRSPVVGPYYVPDFAVPKHGGRLYYVGGTENEINGYRHDNPVIECDRVSGAKRVLCRLNEETTRRNLGRFLHNYAAALSRDERTLYLCPNLAGGRVAIVAVPLAQEGGQRP